MLHHQESNQCAVSPIDMVIKVRLSLRPAQDSSSRFRVTPQDVAYPDGLGQGAVVHVAARVGSDSGASTSFDGRMVVSLQGDPDPGRDTGVEKLRIYAWKGWRLNAL